jgi:hypothetical protein
MTERSKESKTEVQYSDLYLDALAPEIRHKAYERDRKVGATRQVINAIPVVLGYIYIGFDTREEINRYEQPTATGLLNFCISKELKIPNLREFSHKTLSQSRMLELENSQAYGSRQG